MSIRVPIAVRLHPNTIEEIKLRARKADTPYLTYIRELLEDFAPGRDTHRLTRRTKKKQHKALRR